MAIAQRNHGRRYLIMVLGCFLALAAILPLCLLRIHQQLPNKYTYLTTGHVQMFLALHQAQLAATPPGQPRLILAGGSSTLYGIRAKQLASALGMPVINFGLNGGLGLDYLLYTIRNAVRPGDTILLSLEYELLANLWALDQRTTINHIIRWSPAYFLQEPSALRHLGALTLEDLLNILPEAMTSSEVPPPNWPVGVCNSHGDFVINKKPALAQRASAKPFDTAKLQFSTPERELSAFMQWAKARDIRVIMNFPPFMDFPEYHSPEAMTAFNQVPTLYKRLGLPFIGSPLANFWPREMFHDTRNHLGAAAADRMTQQVLRQLSPFFKTHVPRPAFWTKNVTLRPSDPTDWLTGATEFDEITNLNADGWTQGVASLSLRDPLPGRFRAVLDVKTIYGRNGEAPTIIGVPGSMRSYTFDKPGRHCLVLENPSSSHDVIIAPPYPASPYSRGESADRRELGLMLGSISLESLTAADSAACAASGNSLTPTHPRPGHPPHSPRHARPAVP